MIRLFWICIGGAAGTAVRYLVSTWAVRTFGPAFPYGTLIVNVVGSFLLGALMQAFTLNPSAPETVRLSLTAGVMGGLTTYSSFNYETTRLFQQGSWVAGSLNLAGTIVLCLLAGMSGAALVRILASH